MGAFDNIKGDIKAQLDKIDYQGDLSDIGNEIGIAIGKYVREKDDDSGWDLTDFIHGVKHGISLVNGTHS
ncbi:MAG: hypothetical protein WC333_01490 [Dehalococcoidia bacterium]|jgi:hypothetical protein